VFEAPEELLVVKAPYYYEGEESSGLMYPQLAARLSLSGRVSEARSNRTANFPRQTLARMRGLIAVGW